MGNPESLTDDILDYLANIQDKLSTNWMDHYSIDDFVINKVFLFSI